MGSLSINHRNSSRELTFLLYMQRRSGRLPRIVYTCEGCG